ncbi:polysaccharide pyruvyl transferase family protein [Aquibacillus kalidii]|uniref:polysaccharide pyruvyl transferase family protein n=1 Tax=Aquibacillus kalidii TaxID=2762597 RepID=UPI0016467BCD|nr:polysaccharide pyruvyl transferase family protein [Aquibacillus kalidii]
MTKKIGIITFHASHNNGSMLQAYALQQIISQFPNYSNEIIDFSSVGQKRFYSIFVIPRNIKELLKNVMFTIFYKKIKSHYGDYERFLKNYMVVSDEKYHSTHELEQANLEYDILISGSDQVWNTKCLDFEDAYFLSFANKNVKRISYAASMAANNIIGEGARIEKKYREYLMNFQNISVRERNSKLWIEELTGRNIDIAADPTLLISPDSWAGLAYNPIDKGDYIFYYVSWYTKETNIEIQKIAKKYNMPVYVVNAKEWVRRGLWQYGFKLANPGGPRMFLSLIKNAKLVFTSSFHGTIFSAVFQKDFWYVKSPIANKNDDRASFILEQLGIEEKLITKDSIEKIDLWQEIDYKEVRKRIDDLKDKSMKYLSDILN